jgi:hypothetical protein
MKIVDVQSCVVGNPWKAWYLVLVHTDEGLTGIGEGEGYLWANALQAFAEQNKELLFIGQDPFRIEEIRRRCRLEFYERWGYGHVSLGVLAAVGEAGDVGEVGLGGRGKKVSSFEVRVSRGRAASAGQEDSDEEREGEKPHSMAE